MSLRSERTKWVMFLPCSKEEVEPRHVFDIVFGVLCLEKAGINPQDISIYIDSPNRNLDGFFHQPRSILIRRKHQQNFLMTCMRITTVI